MVISLLSHAICVRSGTVKTEDLDVSIHQGCEPSFCKTFSYTTNLASCSSRLFLRRMLSA